MKYTTIAATEAPRRAVRQNQEQVEYDLAIASLVDSDGKALVINVEPEQDPKSIKTRLTRAGTRAGVKVRSWYDAGTAKVYCELRS